MPVIVGGCASYQAALHLMRTGAVGVLVGRRPRPRLHDPRACSASACPRPPPSPTPGPPACATSTRPASTSTSSPTAAWRTGGDIAKAIVCGADAVMIGSPLAAADEAPGRGFHWGMATFHPTLPRGARVRTPIRGTLEEILVGPAHENDGRMNLFGAPAHLDGHLRLRDAQGVPEGRGHGGSGPADRGQGRSSGPQQRRAWATDRAVDRPRASTPSWSSTSARSTPSSSPAGSARRTSTARSSRTRSPPPSWPRARPRGVILSGGPKSVHVPGRARHRPRRLRARRARARHLLRRPARGPAARRRGGPHRPGRVRPHRPRRATGEPSACCSTGDQTGVDEPLRLDRAGARGLPRSPPAPPRRRSPCSSTPSRRIHGVQFHPEVVAHAARPGAPAALPLRRLRLPADLDDGVDHRRPQVEPVRAQVGDERVDLRAVGRRRLRGGGRARAPGRRPPAHLRLRRHRAACARARASQVVETFRRHHGHRAHPRRRRRALLRAPGGRDRPRGEAQGHRRAVHPGLRGEHRRPHRRPLPRAGHALPRRHRERARPTPRSIKSHHNVGGLPDDMDLELVEPLRSLFKDEVRRRRRRARAARRDRVAPALPRARASAVRIIGEVTPEKVGAPPGGRRHRARGDPRRRASSGRSGRPSRCCPTSARSA